jgi:hypothetical protein
MTAAAFANFSKQAPTLARGAEHSYTCHVAALHWAFRDLGATEADAGAMVEAIAVAKCAGCQSGKTMGGYPLHDSIQNAWYGANLCGGSTKIPDRDALYGAVAVGDVLIVGKPAWPAHSMVVVQKTEFIRKWVYVRGFNNTACLGTGPKDGYDNSDQDVDKQKYWHAGEGKTHFGQSFSTGGALRVIPYATYSAAAAAVQVHCNNGVNGWTYNGP